MAVALAGVLVAGTLVALAGPLLAAAAAAAPGDAAASDLRHRKPVTDDALLTIIDSRAQALGRYGAVEWRRELATASLIPRRDHPVSDAAIERGREQTLAALAVAPASPQDWLRLTQIDLVSEDRPAAAGHLATALLTGADMPRLRMGVVGAGFDLWRDLSAQTKLLVLNCIRHEWEAGRNRARLVAYAKQAGLVPLLVMTVQDAPGFATYRARVGL